VSSRARGFQHQPSVFPSVFSNDIFRCLNARLPLDIWDLIYLLETSSLLSSEHFLLYLYPSYIVMIARWITNNNHLSSNLGVGISEGCFIFDLASLPLEVARLIEPTMCKKNGRRTSIIILYRKVPYCITIFWKGNDSLIELAGCRDKTNVYFTI